MKLTAMLKFMGFGLGLVSVFTLNAPYLAFSETSSGKSEQSIEKKTDIKDNTNGTKKEDKKKKEIGC